jgi:hypothetical protein
MRFRILVLLLIALMPVAVLFGEKAIAQTPGQISKSVSPASGKVQANLAQLMRGILFPNSNVIFAAQNQDPAAIKPDADPTQSPNPLTGTEDGRQLRIVAWL